MRLKNKICVITGGTSGIGETTVIRFVEEGAKVVFCGTNEEKAKKVLQKVKEISTGKALFYKCDVSNEIQVEGLATFTKEKFGNCEVLFTNAGVHYEGSLHETPPHEWDRVMNIDVRGVYLVCYYFLPQMIEENYGTIIHMASVSGVLADISMAVYNTAKGAIVNLTRSMALDYAKKNIRVNCVCPGAIKTPIFQKFCDADPEFEKKFNASYPTGKVGECIDVANVCVFLASRESDFMNGANILIDGGITAYTGQAAKDK